MKERAARLRAFIHSQAWKDLNALVTESVQALLQESMNAEKDEDATRLLHEARAAQKFAFELMARIESTAQPGEDD